MQKAWRHLLPASPALSEVTSAAPQASVSCTFQHQPPRVASWLERTCPNPASYYLSPGCGGNVGCPHLQLCFCLAVGNKPLLQLLISLNCFLERLPQDRASCHSTPRSPPPLRRAGQGSTTTRLSSYQPRCMRQLRSHNLS